MQQLRHFAPPALAALFALLQGCWVGQTMCRGIGNARDSVGCKADDASSAATEEEPTGVSGGSQPNAGSYVPPPIRTTTTDTFVADGGFALTRVTPEQLSNNIVATSGFADHIYYDGYSGQTGDYLQVLYGVPLGGIDFVAASRRDPSTKAQTLLVSRIASYQMGLQAVVKDYFRGAGARVMFTKCTMESDRPFGAVGDDLLPPGWQDSIKASEIPWNEQVDELFWRFFARPPSDVERAAVKAAFLAGIDEHQSTIHGWAAVVYALMAAQEFWHI